jgi:hypothetical protein
MGVCRQPLAPVFLWPEGTGKVGAQRKEMQPGVKGPQAPRIATRIGKSENEAPAAAFMQPCAG